MSLFPSKAPSPVRDEPSDFQDAVRQQLQVILTESGNLATMKMDEAETREAAIAIEHAVGRIDELCAARPVAVAQQVPSVAEALWGSVKGVAASAANVVLGPIQEPPPNWPPVRGAAPIAPSDTAQMTRDPMDVVGWLGSMAGSPVVVAQTCNAFVVPRGHLSNDKCGKTLPCTDHPAGDGLQRFECPYCGVPKTYDHYGHDDTFDGCDDCAKERRECAYHVGLHPDEKCTCPRRRTTDHPAENVKAHPVVRCEVGGCVLGYETEQRETTTVCDGHHAYIGDGTGRGCREATDVLQAGTCGQGKEAHIHEPSCVEPLASQIDRLAKFIQSEIPGEPSQEGAVDCAIRTMCTMQSKHDVLQKHYSLLEAQNFDLTHERDALKQQVTQARENDVAWMERATKDAATLVINRLGELGKNSGRPVFTQNAVTWVVDVHACIQAAVLAAIRDARNQENK